MSFLLLLVTSAAFAHVTEIRVNQAQDGSLTWYLVSYHGATECGIGGSGLTINGINYPLQSSHPGDASTLSPNVFAQSPFLYSYGGRQSYAIVRTPFLGTSLSVQPYSTNACWAFSVGGSGNFTPPPPPVCSTSPLTGWSNTFAASGNNNGTACNPNDDKTTATIKVSHLACANITGDKQFRVIFDPAGANVAYGPFYYGSGVETSVNISIPYGTSNATQVQVMDDDFPAQITHALSVPGGQYLGEKETVPPTLVLPAAMHLVNDAGACGAVVRYAAPGAADNCGGATILQLAGLPSGSVFPTGTTVNTFQATDAAGNTTTASFTVTVKDTEAPALLTQDGLLPVITAECTTTVNAVPTAKDNCAGTVTGTTTDPLTYATPGTHVITWKFDDGNGNLSTATQQVVVKDVTAPTITAPAAIAVLLEAGKCEAVVALGTPATADNCGVASVRSDAPAFFPAGTTTVTWTVRDVNGLSATATQTVTVTDAEAPVALAKNIAVTLVGGTATIAAADIDNGSSDACGIASMTLSRTSFSCGEIGDHPVTLTVRDKNGNVAAATAVVTVTGVQAVAAVAVSRTDATFTGAGTEHTIFLGYGAQSLILRASNAASAAAATTYAWSPALGLSSSSSADAVFTPTQAGSYTFTVTATNEFGCSASATVTITVIDAREARGKIVMCHKGKKTIIAASAVQAHLAHGCTLGACASNATPNARLVTNIQAADELGLTVYPNPAVNKATLEFTLIEEGSYQVAVYDMRGVLVKVVDRGQGEANKFYSYELDAAAYPAGVYLVKLSTGQQVLTQRIVVQK